MAAVAGALFFYAITLFGNALPERALTMDSPEACQAAVASFLNGPFVKNIQDNGGHCRRWLPVEREHSGCRVTL
jgi:hypothetical protein